MLVIDKVAADPTSFGKVVQEQIDLDRSEIVIHGQAHALDLPWIANQAALLIGEVPKGDVEQPGVTGQAGELLIAPRLRLDRPDPGHRYSTFPTTLKYG